MLTDADLRQMLLDFIGREKPTVLATVMAVDAEAGLCDVNDDGLAIYNVRLQSIAPNSLGIKLIPKIGSMALILKIEDRDDYVVISASSYESLDFYADSIIGFNGGKNGGLTKIEALISKINRLETALKEHQHGYIPYPSGSPGPPVATTPATALAPPDTTLVFDNTLRSELENTKVTH